MAFGKFRRTTRRTFCADVLTFYRSGYSRNCPRKGPPYAKISLDPYHYIDPKYLPPDFLEHAHRFSDPSRIQVDLLGSIIKHIQKRRLEGCEIAFEFKSPDEDEEIEIEGEYEDEEEPADEIPGVRIIEEPVAVARRTAQRQRHGAIDNFPPNERDSERTAESSKAGTNTVRPKGKEVDKSNARSSKAVPSADHPDDEEEEILEGLLQIEAGGSDDEEHDDSGGEDGVNSGREASRHDTTLETARGGTSTASDGLLAVRDENRPRTTETQQAAPVEVEQVVSSEPTGPTASPQVERGSPASAGSDWSGRAHFLKVLWSDKNYRDLVERITTSQVRTFPAHHSIPLTQCESQQTTSSLRMVEMPDAPIATWASWMNPERWTPPALHAEDGSRWIGIFMRHFSESADIYAGSTGVLEYFALTVGLLVRDIFASQFAQCDPDEQVSVRYPPWIVESCLPFSTIDLITATVQKVWNHVKTRPMAYPSSYLPTAPTPAVNRDAKRQSEKHNSFKTDDGVLDPELVQNPRPTAGPSSSRSNPRPAQLTPGSALALEHAELLAMGPRLPPPSFPTVEAPANKAKPSKKAAKPKARQPPRKKKPVEPAEVLIPARSTPPAEELSANDPEPSRPPNSRQSDRLQAKPKFHWMPSGDRTIDEQEPEPEQVATGPPAKRRVTQLSEEPATGPVKRPRKTKKGVSKRS